MIMQFQKILFGIFLLLLGTAYGQSAKDTCIKFMRGKILDGETKEPIPYVTIKVKDTDNRTFSDDNGDFELKNLCDHSNTLIISCFGYCDSICEENHQHGKSPHIYLTQKVTLLDTVLIISEKHREDGTISIAQEVLTKEDLRSNPSQSLASALSEIEGVSLVSKGTNVQLPVIHGLYGNRVLILNNGLKHGFQNWGSDHAPEIDVSAAHNITVLKGAAGVRFGPEALGGAIIVESNPLLLNKSFMAQLGTGCQSNGKGVSTTIELGKGLKNWSYFAGANYTKIGDRNAPRYVLSNSGKEEKTANAGLRYMHNTWGAKLYYSYVDQNLALLRSSVASSGNAFVKAINGDGPTFIKPFSYQISAPNQLTKHHLAKAEVDWYYSNSGKITFRAGKQLNKREEYDIRRNIEKPIIDLDLVSTDYQIEWKHPDLKKLDGLVGVQMFTQNNNNNPGTGTTPFIPNYKTVRYSAFIVESLRKEKNTYELGFRLDHEKNRLSGRETNQEEFNDNFIFTNLTTSIGFVREISEQSTLRINLGTAWRAPNMAELYSFGQHGFKSSFGLLRYYTSQDGGLQTDKILAMAEQNISAEKGFKWINEWQVKLEKHQFNTTVYSHYIKNYTFDRPVAIIGTVRGPMPVFIFDQADAFFVGADFTWQKQWTKNISAVFGASYLWSKNVKKNESLINQPPITANYKLMYNLPKLWKLESSQLRLRPSYTFRQFQSPRTASPTELIDGSVQLTPESEIFDFKHAPNGYFLIDIGWKFKLKNFTASIDVKNMLNTRYRDYLNEMRYFADDMGVNFLLSINYTLNSKSNKK